MGEAGLADRLATVRAEIERAAADASRSADELTTVVVTKFQPESMLAELVRLGESDLGESRHQEVRVKSRSLTGLGIRWHFVGQLQSKKARQAREYAGVVHSLDRGSLLDALATDDPEAGTVDAFIQVNLTDDPARGGVDPAAIAPFAERVTAAPGVRLLGVMAVAPMDEEPRSAFARLRSASDTVRSIDAGARFISAGMSGDFREAILEGATHLRIGSAITGNRPAAG